MRYFRVSTPYTPATLILFLFVGLIGAGTLLAACDSGGDSGSDQSALMPLKVGNSWTYEVRSGNSTEQATLEITDSRTINGEQYYEMDPGIDQYETDGEPFFVGREEEGLFLAEADLVEFPLKYPAEDGDIYNHTDSDGNEYKVTVSNKTLEVPAGTFDCLQYKVEFDGPGGESGFGSVSGSTCISPDVGPIRINLISLEASLGSYSLK